MSKKKIAQKIRHVLSKNRKFESSLKYWDDRYSDGGNSGSGSYGQLAEFKAEVINDFIKQQNISSVVEFGCGDGNQLKYYDFREYLGYDVSTTVLDRCCEMFSGDTTKEFRDLAAYKDEKSDMSMSIDVIYHLVEDAIFKDHIRKLFHSADKFVIIYSSNFDYRDETGKYDHVRHRNFTDWIDKHIEGFNLREHIPNRFSRKVNDGNSTHADFFIYERIQTDSQ